MSGGLLGKGSPQPNQFLTLYTMPTGEMYATVDITCVNLNASDAKIRVAITSNPAPSQVDFIEFDATVKGGGGGYDKKAQLLSPGESIIVYSDTSQVVFRAMGVEEDYVLV